MTSVFVSRLSPQPPLVIEFNRVGPGRVRCALCEEENPLGSMLMRWVDGHLRDKHPGWGEARVETR